MTPQEALTELKASIEGCGFQCHMETYNMAISALEKTIPKKPKGKTDPMFGDTTIVCQNCGNANLANPFDISRVYDYCPNCGQALDWSGV